MYVRMQLPAKVNVHAVVHSPQMSCSELERQGSIVSPLQEWENGVQSQAERVGCAERVPPLLTGDNKLFQLLLGHLPTPDKCTQPTTQGQTY